MLGMLVIEVPCTLILATAHCYRADPAVVHASTVSPPVKQISKVSHEQTDAPNTNWPLHHEITQPCRAAHICW